MELPTVLIGIESVKIARNKHTTVTQQSHDTYYTQLIKIRNSQAYYLFPSSGATYVQHWISSSSHHTHQLHQLPKESFSDVRHSPDMDISNINSRVVLLLDLDCFYAQCETVRLGLDPSMPLCLLQWNSALAVNYPARERFNLKRGASFAEIRKVSGGESRKL